MTTNGASFLLPQKWAIFLEKPCGLWGIMPNQVVSLYFVTTFLSSCGGQMCAVDAAGRVTLPPALPEGKATSLDRGRQEVRRIERSAEKILEAGGS